MLHNCWVCEDGVVGQEAQVDTLDILHKDATELSGESDRCKTHGVCNRCHRDWQSGPTDSKACALYTHHIHFIDTNPPVIDTLDHHNEPQSLVHRRCTFDAASNSNNTVSNQCHGKLSAPLSPWPGCV